MAKVYLGKKYNIIFFLLFSFPNILHFITRLTVDGKMWQQWWAQTGCCLPVSWRLPVGHFPHGWTCRIFHILSGLLLSNMGCGIKLFNTQKEKIYVNGIFNWIKIILMIITFHLRYLHMALSCTYKYVASHYASASLWVIDYVTMLSKNSPDLSFSVGESLLHQGQVTGNRIGAFLWTKFTYKG